MRCTCYIDGVRCRSEATTALLAPGEEASKYVAPMCRYHGEIVLREYRDNLDPRWRMVEVYEWGKVKQGGVTA